MGHHRPRQRGAWSTQEHVLDHWRRRLLHLGYSRSRVRRARHGGYEFEKTTARATKLVHRAQEQVDIRLLAQHLAFLLQVHPDGSTHLWARQHLARDRGDGRPHFL